MNAIKNFLRPNIVKIAFLVVFSMAGFVDFIMEQLKGIGASLDGGSDAPSLFYYFFGALQISFVEYCINHLCPNYLCFCSSFGAMDLSV